MPIFDFQCEDCGHEFEKLVLKSDAPAPACISCSSDDVVKKVSAPGFRLSGSGWYETDFKTGKKKNLAGNKENSSNSAS
jgi:putative FmdB family regulatory protein